MIRQIINIDEEKCNGCGICVTACHEGAIEIIDGKAKLVREHFCDGFGDCLPECPAGAITFEEREAPEYDEAAVLARKEELARVEMDDVKVREAADRVRAEMAGGGAVAGGFGGSAAGAEGTCPGSAMRQMHRGGAVHGAVTGHGCPGEAMHRFHRNSAGENPAEVGEQEDRQYGRPVSQLAQWPAQIKLVPPTAPFFDGAKLLVAADCTAYAYANMHEEFMKGRVTLIGCPKLDGVDYTEKLTQIIANNDIKSVTIVRMEVPCCGGMQMAVQNAIMASGKFFPWQVVTISLDGHIID